MCIERRQFCQYIDKAVSWTTEEQGFDWLKDKKFPFFIQLPIYWVPETVSTNWILIAKYVEGNCSGLLVGTIHPSKQIFRFQVDHFICHFSS